LTQTTQNVTLTDEQLGVFNPVMDWIRASQTPDNKELPFKTIGGFAGVGKSVLARAIYDAVSEELEFTPHACALSAKAAYNLRKKGVSVADTIHKLIYFKPEVVQGTNDELELSFSLRRFDLDGNKFTLNPLVIVDEATMIPENVLDDLLSFNVPCLFIGDMGQLPPVGSDRFLMENPDYRLTTVHRQALGNPIIAASMYLRLNGTIYGYTPPDERVSILDAADFKDLAYDGHDLVDQFIVGFNATRRMVNQIVRERRGYTKLLEPGDKLICLKNNRAFATFNGMMCTVKNVLKESASYVTVDVVTDIGQRIDGMNIDRTVLETGQFARDAYIKNRDTITYWDYGYAITCHKAQGSEWDTVAVKSECHRDWDHTRWLYTAITRASKNLILCR
jgi:exodeoxyribonuclease-5